MRAAVRIGSSGRSMRMPSLTLATLAAVTMTAVASSAAADTPATAAKPDGALRNAYLKELAFLKSEKRTLTARVAEVTQSGRARVEAAQAEVERAEGQLLALRRRADLLEESLRQAETAAGSKAQPEDIEAMIEQAAEALSHAGVKTRDVEAQASDPDPKNDDGEAASGAVREATLAAKVGAIFGDAASAMRRAGASRTEEGEFFLSDGTLTRGKIFRFGSVAAFGVSDKASGALAPAGGSKLRLWPEPASETASALLSGASPATMRLFLFESTDKSIEPKKERGVYEEATLGGMIAWVIVALGCVSVVMILFRFVTLLMASASGRSLTRKVLDAVVARRFREAESIAAQARGAAARVLRAALRNLGAERAHLEDLLHEAILNETPAIERFGSAITVFAAVAPLLGLLGTVTGMIATFDVITEFGTGDPRMLSGGISEALITTKFGLVVAIPCLLIGNLLAGWGDATIADIEHAALRVVNAAHGLDLDEDGENAGAGQATEPRSTATVEPELA